MQQRITMVPGTSLHGDTNEQCPANEEFGMVLSTPKEIRLFHPQSDGAGNFCPSRTVLLAKSLVLECCTLIPIVAVS